MSWFTWLKSFASASICALNAGSSSLAFCCSQGSSAIACQLGLSRNGCTVPCHAMTMPFPRSAIWATMLAPLSFSARIFAICSSSGSSLAIDCSAAKVTGSPVSRRELAHPAKLVPFAHHVAGHLEHAVPGAAHRAADADQLFGGGGGAGHDLAVDRAVEHGAARSKSPARRRARLPRRSCPSRRCLRLSARRPGISRSPST